MIWGAQADELCSFAHEGSKIRLLDPESRYSKIPKGNQHLHHLKAEPVNFLQHTLGPPVSREDGIGQMHHGGKKVAEVVSQTGSDQVDHLLSLGDLDPVAQRLLLAGERFALTDVPPDPDDLTLRHFGQAELLFENRSIRPLCVNISAPPALSPQLGEGARCQVRSRFGIKEIQPGGADELTRIIDPKKTRMGRVGI